MHSLTVGDLIKAWAGQEKKVRIQVPDPTFEQLNDGMTQPFVPPADDVLVDIKRQLSYEAWLHIKGADQLGVFYNQRTARYELEGHVNQLLTLLGEEAMELPVTHPAVQSRLLWLKLRIQSLCAQELHKVYYELTAEATVERARHTAASKRLVESLTQEERQAYLREIWGDLPEALLETLNNEREAYTEERLGTVAPHRSRSGGVHDPGFREWWIDELVKRPLDEIDAYLAVQWRVEAVLNDRPGDRRQGVSIEQANHLLKIIKWGTPQVAPSEQLVLKQASKWFKRRIKDAEEARIQRALIPAPLPIKEAQERTSDGHHMQSIVASFEETQKSRLKQGRGRPRKISLNLNLDDLLSPSFKRDKLDEFLVKIKMLDFDEKTKKSTASPSATPGQWSMLRAALAKYFLIPVALSDDDATQAFRQAYNANVNRATMSNGPVSSQQRGATKKTTKKTQFYEMLLTRLKELTALT